MDFTGSYAAMFNSREIPVPVVSARCLNNKEKEMDDGLYTLSLVCEPLLSVHLFKLLPGQMMNLSILQIRKFLRGFYFRETSHMRSFVKI